MYLCVVIVVVIISRLMNNYAMKVYAKTTTTHLHIHIPTWLGITLKIKNLHNLSKKIPHQFPFMPHRAMWTSLENGCKALNDTFTKRLSSTPQKFFYLKPFKSIVNRNMALAYIHK